MFRMNLDAWAADPVLVERLGPGLEALGRDGRRGPIVWSMRQVAVRSRRQRGARAPEIRLAFRSRR